jgi:hypothetical protein
MRRCVLPQQLRLHGNKLLLLLLLLLFLGHTICTFVPAPFVLVKQVNRVPQHQGERGGEQAQRRQQRPAHKSTQMLTNVQLLTPAGGVAALARSLRPQTLVA